MKCNTPIDSGTKMALSGEALEAALKAPDSPRCGYELAADDVFCPACGAKVGNHSSSQGDVLLVGPDSVSKGKNLFLWLKSLVKGRASRRKYWLVGLTATLCYVLVSAVLFLIETSRFDQILAYMALIVAICIVPVSVRRFHDLGKSGLWMLAFAIAPIGALCSSDVEVIKSFTQLALVINLILGVPMGFVRGTRGPNKYGPDPLEMK